MIPLLKPLFPGEWAIYGDTLDNAPHYPADAIPISRLIYDDALAAAAIRRYANHLGVEGRDLRAAASAWSLVYLWKLLPPIAAAATVLQHSLPAAAWEMAVSLDRAGAPVRFHIAGEGFPMTGAATAARYRNLLEQHLAPLFAVIARRTRLPEKILWGNTARYLEVIFDQAEALMGKAAHIDADRDALLHQPLWAEEPINPLFGHQSESTHLVDGSAVTVKLHRHCCLTYRLPGREYCSACPLAPSPTPATTQRESANL